MSPFWWRKLLFTRPVRHTRRPARPKLWVEPLEHRDTPSIYAAAVGPGSPPVVNVYDSSTNAQLFTITAYDASFTGGVNVAVGDVNGDGTADIITGAGSGGGPTVNVYSGKDGSLLASYSVGDAGSRAGVSVAAGDFDGDGKSEVVVGAVQNGQPYVAVLNGLTGAVEKSFTPFAGASAVSVAVGDVNADGTPDVIAGAGVGGGPEVTVFDGKTGDVLLDQYAFEDTFMGGVHVSSGDVDGDGHADVIVGAGTGGGPRVVVLDGATGTMIDSFYAYDASGRSGVMASLYTDSTGTKQLVTQLGTGDTTTVQAFNTSTLTSVTLPAAMTGLPEGPVALTGTTSGTGTTTTTTGSTGTDTGGTTSTGSTGSTGTTTGTTDASGMTSTMPAVDDPRWAAVGTDGVKFIDETTGSGTAVTAGSTITAYYTGWLAADGTQFQTNTTSTPFTSALTGLIKGWQEGLVGMEPGGIRDLSIPAAEAYGSTGSGTTIPPNSDLVFQIKLVSVS